MLPNPNPNPQPQPGQNQNPVQPQNPNARHWYQNPIVQRAGIIGAATLVVLVGGIVIGKGGCSGRQPDKNAGNAYQGTPTDPSYGKAINAGINQANGVGALAQARRNAITARAQEDVIEAQRLRIAFLAAQSVSMTVGEAYDTTVCSRDGRRFDANARNSTYCSPLQELEIPRNSPLYRGR